jgi:3-oxoadipate enol-lactonase
MNFDSRMRLGQIGCPTLVIAGSKDQAVPTHHAKMLHDGIAGSQLAVVDGAGHTLIWTHRGEFVRLVEDFLGTAVGGQ